MEDKENSTGQVSQEKEVLLKPGEVAKFFRVDPKTVGRWAKDKRVGSLRTPGGHRRFRAQEIKELLEKSYTKATALAKMQELEQMITERLKHERASS